MATCQMVQFAATIAAHRQSTNKPATLTLLPGDFFNLLTE
jgi:hypothetical protein